jgi:hypothetical protein
MAKAKKEQETESPAPDAAKEKVTNNPVARYQVRTANPAFSGERCGLRFRDGAASTDDAQQAAEFAALGYQVTDLAEKKAD